MKMNERGFFIFYDWIDDLDYLDGESAWKIIKSLCEFCRRGIDPIEELEDGKLRGMISLMLHQIQRSREISDIRADAGQKGGFAKANNSKDIALPEQKVPTKTITNTKTNIISPPLYIPPSQEEGTESTKTRRFVKPSLEDVRAYCQSRNNSVDAERFISYYESNGWRVGKNPMKDWKAAVRTWERGGAFGTSSNEKSRPSVGALGNSFDTDDFLEAALARSTQMLHDHASGK